MEKIGKYRILGKIGEGGMGVVYKALDPLLERVVAVKTISSRLDSEPNLRERFFREGRSAAHLSNKNIITIYDLGEDNGMAYMAMEFLDGEDLRAKIRKNEIRSLDSKLGIMFEICAGLAHAHGRRVIHRDIKPANVFITTSGQVKILDFGLARMMSTEATRTGVTPGSPNYMSPEQVRGDDLDHRTDIFSAGALFYEFLTLRKPFEGESLAAIIYSILHSQPESPQLIDPTLSPRLSSIVMKALAKDPATRYQSMLEVIHDLRECFPYVRSLPLSEAESREVPAVTLSDDAPTVRMRDDVPTLSLADIHGSGSNSSLAGNPPEPTRAEPPVISRVRKDDNHAALHARRLGRHRIIYVGAACLVLASSATVIWWAGRHPGIQGAGSVAASAQHAREPASVAAPGALPGIGGQRTASAGTPEATSEPSQGSAAKRDQKPAADAQEDLQAREHSALPKATDAPARGNDDAAKIVDRGIQETKSLLAQGRNLEASASLSEVLKIAPLNPEARQLAGLLASHEKKTADDALGKMIDSKRRADAAAADQYAAKSFEAAQSREAAAREAYAARRFNEAAAAFIETNGLYLSAALEAESEKAARENRARTLEQERQRTLQRQQADLSRNAYEQERLDAVKADAETKAPQKYQEAIQLAAGAGVKWDREDFAGSKVDFDKAAEAMRLAKTEVRDAARKSEPPAADASPKPVVPSTAGSNPTDNSLQAITAALQQYAASLQARDMQMLRNIWPGIGAEQEKALQEEFRNAREIQVRIVGIEIKITGDAAIATARRTYILLTVDGQRLQTETRIVVNLRRNGKAWFIDKIRFEPT